MSKNQYGGSGFERMILAGNVTKSALQISSEALGLLRRAAIPSEFLEAVQELEPRMERQVSAWEQVLTPVRGSETVDQTFPSEWVATDLVNSGGRESIPQESPPIRGYITQPELRIDLIGASVSPGVEKNIQGKNLHEIGILLSPLLMWMTNCDIVCKTDCRRYLFDYPAEIADIVIARYQVVKKGQSFSLSTEQKNLIDNLASEIGKKIDEKKDPPCDGFSDALTGKKIAPKIKKILENKINTSIWLAETVSTIVPISVNIKVPEGDPCKYIIGICALTVEITPNKAAAEKYKAIDGFEMVDAKIIRESTFGHEAGHTALIMLGMRVVCERLNKIGKLAETNIDNEVKKIVVEVMTLRKKYDEAKDDPTKFPKNKKDLEQQAPNSEKESKDFIKEAKGKGWVEKVTADKMIKQLDDFSQWIEKNCKTVDLREK